MVLCLGVALELDQAQLYSLAADSTGRSLCWLDLRPIDFVMVHVNAWLIVIVYLPQPHVPYGYLGI